VIPLGSRRLNEEWISLGQLPFRRGENMDEKTMDATFKSLFWNLHSGSQAVSGPIDPGMSTHEGFCMEGAMPDNNQVDVSCFFSAAGWQADFVGNKKDMQEFLSIVRRLGFSLQ
jgi:hypothetical protein